MDIEMFRNNALYYDCAESMGGSFDCGYRYGRELSKYYHSEYDKNDNVIFVHFGVLEMFHNRWDHGINYLYLNLKHVYLAWLADFHPREYNRCREDDLRIHHAVNLLSVAFGDYNELTNVTHSSVASHSTLCLDYILTRLFDEVNVLERITCPIGIRLPESKVNSFVENLEIKHRLSLNDDGEIETKKRRL